MKNIALLVLLVFSTAVLIAGVSVNYSLEMPKIDSNGQYTKIKLENTQSWGQPGNPDLPWFGIKILLPEGMEADKIVVSKTDPVVYSLPKLVSPIQKQYPFSHKIIETPDAPNLEVYNSSAIYPDNPDNGVRTEFLCGHPIAMSAISPFEYCPLKNELVFYRNLSVDISYSTSSKAMDAMRFLKNDAYTVNRLQKAVDNPETIIMNQTRDAGVEYLIVIDASKEMQWTPFKTFQEARGRNVLMKTMTDITNNTIGIDTQDKLRNYIISLYTTNPLRYVFLAGDTDVIPHRGFYVSVSDGDEYTDADIPADMYYSCLDGTWNDDGDSYWGEMYETDLAPELAIGRFCYNDDSEITNFLNKLNSYTNNPITNGIKTALFVGE